MKYEMGNLHPGNVFSSLFYEPKAGDDLILKNYCQGVEIVQIYFVRLWLRCSTGYLFLTPFSNMILEKNLAA